MGCSVRKVERTTALRFWKCYAYTGKELTRNCGESGFRERGSKPACEPSQELGQPPKEWCTTESAMGSVEQCVVSHAVGEVKREPGG